MKGKIGIVVGLAAGYVLGARAGRGRYEQIKEKYLEVWNAAPVQKQVGKAKEFGKTAALAVPTALWDGAVKITKAATAPGTPSEKFDAAVRAGKQSASHVAEGVQKSADAAKAAAEQGTAERDEPTGA